MLRWARCMQVRAALAASAVPVRLVAGHNLYEEGDKADSFYLLQEGEHQVCALVLGSCERVRSRTFGWPRPGTHGS